MYWRPLLVTLLLSIAPPAAHSSDPLLAGYEPTETNSTVASADNGITTRLPLDGGSPPGTQGSKIAVTDFRYSHAVDHYKVYSVEMGPMAPLQIHLQDQFGEGLVDLTNLGKLGVPVSKAIAPDPPSGDLFRPFEHLTWYQFSEPQPPLMARLKNQFTRENKGALWNVGDGAFLLVPAIVDGLGAIDLGQHWKCYDADLHVKSSRGRTLPNVTVNLVDQFHSEPNVDVRPGRYLCNPVQKTVPPNSPEPPPPLPEEHLACYDILDAPLDQIHLLEDQFGSHEGSVEFPELLCLPSQKFLGTGLDSDGDGIEDALDNCSLRVNTGQDDTDADDCGNLCDVDYDNYGVPGFADFGAFVIAFGTTDEEKCHVEPIPGCTVGFGDFGFMVANFGVPPGPSGTTAGTTACP